MKVNINKATEKELLDIIHIGKVRAGKIVKRRPFKDIFELSNVLGLGEKRMNDIIQQNIASV